MSLTLCSRHQDCYPNDNLHFSYKNESLDSDESDNCSFPDIELSDEWAKIIESNPSDISKNNVASSNEIVDYLFFLKQWFFYEHF